MYTWTGAMWTVADAVEAFRCLLIVLLTIQWSGSVEGVQQFSIHRMQHLDVGATGFGSPVAYVNMEGRSTQSPVLNRRCVFVKWKDLSMAIFDNLLERGMGAIVILMPGSFADISDSVREEWRELERQLLFKDIKIPVYFMTENEQILSIIQNMDDDAVRSNTSSVLASVLGSFGSYGYYMTTRGAEPKKLTHSLVPSISGLLKGSGIADQLPTVALVTHYDAFGISTGHSRGADASGTSVVAMLELARLFNKLYSNSLTKPRYNLLFLISGGGKLGYFGSRKWLDNNSDSWLLGSVDFFLCLESLGSEELYLHVARHPKNGSHLAIFTDHLNSSAQFIFNKRIHTIHKKIRASDDLLSWEHERFALMKQPAVTLSRHAAHGSYERYTVFDDMSVINEAVLVRNVEIVAEAVSRYIYELPPAYQGRLFKDHLAVNRELVMSQLRFLTSHTRSQQLLHSDHAVVQFILQTLSRYTSDVQKHVYTTSKSDPEFHFYDMMSTELQVFSVKPPIFDLFLAIVIALYILFVYILVQKFDVITSLFSGNHKVKLS